MKRSIPWLMIAIRVALCPAILLAAWHNLDGKWLGLIVLVALVDDIYDGILARCWQCDTPSLRLADSTADTVFYLGTAGALWIRQPQVLRNNWPLLAILFSLEALRYAVDFTKFGKAASYHSWLAKLWGLVLATALIGVLSFGGLHLLVRLAILLGIVVNLEGLAMSLLLRRWQNDVRTLAAARRLRAKQADPRQPA